MREYNSFEILGPIMVGPSSSHTAGACKIANVAAKICKGDFQKVQFYLHGSFAHTYKGHGTDRALLGGIMGMSTYDENIRHAYEIADEKKLDYEFIPTNLGDEYHPNTVKILFIYDDRQEYVIGSSIGGGNIVIVDIDGMKVDFKGDHPTMLFQYDEQKGVIAYVSSLLTGNDYNIESINTIKDVLTNIVTLTIEVERPLSDSLRTALMETSRFIRAKYLEV